MYDYNNSAYTRTKLTFNYCYNNLREEADSDRAINRPREILGEKWTLVWDGGRRWGHMITSLVELINLVLKKTQNLSTSVMIKSTYKV